LNQAQGLNQGWIYTDRIRPTDAGQSVLEFYAQRYRHSNRDEWHQRIVAGIILLDGCTTTPDAILLPGQQLEYHRPPWMEPTVPLDIAEIYSDDHLLVIGKPSGLPVLPGGNFLTHTLLHQVSLRYPDNPPVPVHRLGRGTSGVMVLARSPLARSRLSRQFRETTAAVAQTGHARSLGKRYRALIGPIDGPDAFTITTPIGKVPHPVFGYGYAATATGRPAHSEVRVLQRRAEATLVEVAIRTGRPHQIRIHLAAAGYPLLGDPLYVAGGQPRNFPGNATASLPVPGDTGYWLHAYQIVCLHPTDHGPRCFTCLPPVELRLPWEDDSAGAGNAPTGL
jgi:23S rRNA pseudouridine1911/1915/1917 synthase